MSITFRILFLIITFTVGAIFQSCGSKAEDNTQQSLKRGTPMVVNGVVAKPQPLDNIVRSSGTVLASESVALVAESAGRIDKISFKEGEHVKNNELLVKINDDDLQAQLKKTDLQIQLSSEQSERQRQLYEKKLISKEEFDISLNQLNSLKADHENLIASIRKREIRAPFDGIIGLRYISEGGYVTQTTRIASIQKVNPLKVDFAIPEKYSGQVSVGDVVRFQIDEGKLQFTGKLYAIEPRIDPATRTLQLRALFDNKSEKVLPGSYTQIELQLKKIQDAIMVPTQAIIPTLKGQTILIRKNGVVASRQINIGIRTASDVQILDGLMPGDTVITTGIMQLRPGMPVTVRAK
jgi:membrane fusion protein (multidrug efflux system)